jgi:hypothetical protein
MNVLNGTTNTAKYIRYTVFSFLHFSTIPFQSSTSKTQNSSYHDLTMPITNKLLKPVVFHRLLTSSGLQVWPVMHKSGQTILLQITNLNTTQIVRAKEKTSTRVLETANNPVDMQLHYSITR